MEGSAKRRRISENDGIATTEGGGTALSSEYDYEVFLSFRGPDTRSDFTDFLYISLTDAGIRTFKDDEELRIGEEFSPELLRAINRSKISVPIFSKGYASSAWCLKELAHMVECQKTKEQKIMPIFYDVAPSEVRYQSGSYGEAFLSHENNKRYDEKTLREWKAALEKVSFLNGWDLQNMPNRREGQFARELTQKIFTELKKAYLVVSDYLVNVDNHVDAIMEKIDAQTRETRIIGIYGMGGIGKTTTAKIIYNQLSENFEGCSFLSNIREMSKCKDIERLQIQLISDILKNKYTGIRNIDDGINIIKERLSNKRVLLLLDDMDEKRQMDALVGERDWFGKGSKLIITTRNKEILDALTVDDSYELTGMDHDQSLQLFSKHAFRRDSPLDEYIDQSNKVIDIAKGLPLALEVIGSLLSRTEKKDWDLTLEQLENVPLTEVRSKLEISYNALTFRQKEIFLDIACLFIGYKKDDLVHFWEKSKYFPELAMDDLQNRSLIKIKEDNRVWMHDQLRDLGRDIVREKSNMKIEMQSRVWDPKEASDLLRKHKEKKRVEVLRLELDSQKQYRFSYESFESLSDLRFLEVVDYNMVNFRAEERLLWHESPSNVFPTNENSDLLPQLRWLSWHQIPSAFNITVFSMEDVVILDLSYSNIADDWKGWSHMKVMKNLKVLDLTGCRLRRTSFLSSLPNLERLNLSGCHSLIGIDECQFKHLISLDISSCYLHRLPDKFGEGLANLEYLSLNPLTPVKILPESIGNLKSLIELDMHNTLIKELPNSIGNLKKLKVLKMKCISLRKIPDVLWSTGNLENVEVSGECLVKHIHVRIGNGISGNQSLRILKLSSAKIDALPRLPESLITLVLDRVDMNTFPDLSNLTNLKELDLRFGPLGREETSDGLVGVSMPLWIGNLSSLESLSLESPCVTTLPADFTFPPRLNSLAFCFKNLPSLPSLPSSLSSLKLLGCESLCAMEDLSNLKKLSTLYISFTAIPEIPGLGCLENLRSLHLWGLSKVRILPDLSNSNKLGDLAVEFCENLVEIQGQLPRFLHSFSVENCDSLEKLPDLSSLRGKGLFSFLVKRGIESCKKLNVETILDVAQLNPHYFELVDFEQLEILPDLSNLNELSHLEVRQCDNLVEIQGELPQSLRVLEIIACKSLRKLPDLSKSTGLQKVRIDHCDLVEIQGKLPQSLEELEVSWCESLQKLPSLSRSMGLREVDIQNCDKLAEIQGELPESLEGLVINSCHSLQELPDLSSLKGLQVVEIKRCGKLNSEAISSLCLEKSVIFVGETTDESESNEYDLRTVNLNLNLNMTQYDSEEDK